jgi:hypothetical protein
MPEQPPYVDPEMAALLPWDLAVRPAAVDWANFGEKELQAMRAEAAEMRARMPRPGPELPRVTAGSRRRVDSRGRTGRDPQLPQLF